ncbi:MULTISPECIES: hypothetical protein [unclassified Campylobacter]|uniref:hypothetical protein n=1 Tax=unclassified Campylobacter TaxID=2593542 RepID=UPI003D33302C
MLLAFKQKTISFISNIAKLFLGITEHIKSDMLEMYDEVHTKLNQERVMTNSFSI